MNWTDFCIRPNESLRNALGMINKFGRHLIVVTDESGVLIGVLTDGDTRRAILSGAELDSPIAEWINRNPLTASISSKKTELELHARRLGLEFIPIVDSENRIVEIYFPKDLRSFSEIPNPVLIMAGGQGKRLHPLTSKTPKPMIQVGGQPLIQILIKKLAFSGFKNIFIAVHYLAEDIIDFLGDGKDYGLNIQYLREETPLGTAGAINLLPRTVLKWDLLVCNSDLIADTDFREMFDSHQSSGAAATVLSSEVNFQIPYGVIEANENKLVSMQEKPQITYAVNGGAYIFGAGFLDKYSSRKSLQATEILEDLISSGESVSVYKSTGYWLDVGTLETLDQARQENLKVLS